MLTVYKYPINPSDEKIELKIPGGGNILSAGLDPVNRLCVWALVDPDEEECATNIYCVGTGWPIDWIMEEEDALNFVGSVKDGPYMWHVFVGGE